MSLQNLSIIFVEILVQQQEFNASNYTLDSELNYSHLLPIPLICLFGILTNILNIAVFLHPKMKDVSFKYMLALAVSDVLYLSFLSASFIIYCKNCVASQTIGYVIYFIVIFYYLTGSLALFDILIENFLSIQRYLLIQNKPFPTLISYKLIIIILCSISFIICLIVPFCFEIIETKTSNKYLYSIVKNRLCKTSNGKFTIIIFGFLRLGLGTGLLSLLNVLNVIALKNRLQTKLKNRVNGKLL